MMELRKALTTYLKTLHPRIYFQLAPETAVFPYIVYDIPNSFSDGEGGEIVTLDVDGWNSKGTGDTTIIEELMESINNLDKKVFSTASMSVVFYLDNRMSMTDADKAIQRRKYIYSGRLIRK